jgi:protoporphyrinogen oxidase
MARDGKVFIVGAGLAGLNCARLLSGEREVEVIESSRRLGGRLKSSLVGGISCEIGANFFAAEDAHIMGLVRELGLDGDARRMDLSRGFVLHNGKEFSIGDGLKGGFSPGEADGLEAFIGFFDDNEDMFADIPPEMLQKDFASWFSDGFGADSLWFVSALLRTICFALPHEVAAAYGALVAASFVSETYALEGGAERIAGALKGRARGALFSMGEEALGIDARGGKAVALKTSKREIALGEGDCVVLACPLPHAARIANSPGLLGASRAIEYRGCASLLCEYGERPLGGRMGLLVADPRSQVSVLLENALKEDAGEKPGSAVTVLSPYSRSPPSPEGMLASAAGIEPKAGKPLRAEFDSWDFGLPIASPAFFAMQERLPLGLAQNVFIAGDYAGLPSLDAAAESGAACAKRILER